MGDLLLFLSPCPWVFLVGEEGVGGVFLQFSDDLLLSSPSVPDLVENVI